MGFQRLSRSTGRLGDSMGKKGLQNVPQHLVQKERRADSALGWSTVPFPYLECARAHVPASAMTSSTSVWRRQKNRKGIWGAAVLGVTCRTPALTPMSRKLQGLYAVCRGQLLTTARKQRKTQGQKWTRLMPCRRVHVTPIRAFQWLHKTGTAVFSSTHFSTHDRSCVKVRCGQEGFLPCSAWRHTPSHSHAAYVCSLLPGLLVTAVGTPTPDL